MASPDISQQAIYQDNNSVFDTVFILEILNYDFTKSVPITISELNVIGISTFNSDVTFSGDISLDEITCRNANVTGIATVGTDLYLNGKLFDGDGDFGTAGQLLSSDGTDLNWIDASTTSVANANNVGTNANSTDADQFITFVGASSGNNPIRVNTNIKYNPSTNTLSAINIAGSSTSVNLNVTGNLTVGGQFKDGDGNFGTSGQVLSSDGTDTAWINAGSLTAGAAAEVGVSAASANANHFITMVDTASGNENIRVDSDLTYNPVTNTLNVPNISGNGSGLSGIEAFVTGMIILWSGAANAIPTGFVLCNGQNNTPDLRGRFVVGYNDNDNDYDVNDTGGSKDNTLSVSQLPSHNHSFSGSASHNHTHTKATHPSGSGPEQNQSGGPEDRTNFGDTGTTSTATVTISGTTGNQGSGSAIENRPPYYALCYIMKT